MSFLEEELKQAAEVCDAWGAQLASMGSREGYLDMCRLAGVLRARLARVIAINDDPTCEVPSCAERWKEALGE